MPLPLAPELVTELRNTLRDLSIPQIQAIEAEQRRAHPAVAAYPTKN
jgi:hypothetical protein